MSENPREATSGESFDIFSLTDDYYRNPDAAFAQMRSHDPVHENSDGSVLLSRYFDVLRVWRDPESLVDKSEHFMMKFGPGPLLEHHTTTMLFRDPPDHDRLRCIVAPFFTPGAVQPFRATIQRRVDALLDDAAEMGTFDFFEHFALDIPITVICELLAIPIADADFLHEFGVQVLFPLNPGVSDDVVRRGHDAVETLCDHLAEYLHQWVRKRDLTGEENVTAALAAAHVAGEISEAEALHMLIVLMNGGHETTSNLLTVGLKELMDQRPQLDLLRSRPEIANSAVEELLRFVSPLQLQGRRIVAPVELPSGHLLESGTEVVVSQASANRDGEVFADAGRLDLTRRPNQHLAFGRGIHACIGQYLTRMEATIALPAIAARFPDIHQVADATFVPNARFRSLSHLPVSIR